MEEYFRKFAQIGSDVVGSAWAFVAALFVVVVWAVSGPFLGFSETWQLIINTGTTITTFLMVFLVQNTQNRDAKATELKLDELIKVQKRANNKLIGVEDKTEKQLEREKRKEKKSKR